MAEYRHSGGGTKRRPSWPSLVGVLAAVGLLSACTFVVDYKDYDGFPACDSGDEQSVRDLRFSMDMMNIHQNQYVEVRVVNVGNFVVARAILDPLVGSAADFQMRGALLEGPHRVEFWADLSNNGAYDAPPADHAWRLDACASGAHVFSHSTNFVDIEDPPRKVVGGDFVINFIGMVPHVGQLLELWVIDVSNGRMVGYYRKADPLVVDYTVRIPGIIEQDAGYDIVFYADKNNNLRYDPPGEDHAWRLTGTGDASGLSFDFEHHTNFADITEDIAL